MKIKYTQENFSIENLTIKEALKKIKRKSKISEYWKWIVKKHEVTYITNYLGSLLLDDRNKKFIKGTMIYDLFNIYYIDFIIKNDLLILCQKIERYLKVAMIQELPNQFYKEKAKTFGSKIDFYGKKHLDDASKNKILRHFEKIINTKFDTVSDFVAFLECVKRIRNFCAHGFNKAKYYNWETNYSKGMYRTIGKYHFKYDFMQLLRGTTRGSILNLKKKMIDLFEHRPFSTDQVSVAVCKKYFGSSTPYSFDWFKYTEKPSDPFSLNKFLKANSRYKKNNNPLEEVDI